MLLDGVTCFDTAMFVQCVSYVPLDLPLPYACQSSLRCGRLHTVCAHLHQTLKASLLCHGAKCRLTSHQCQRHQSAVTAVQAAGAECQLARHFEMLLALVVQPAQHFAGLHRLVA